MATNESYKLTLDISPLLELDEFSLLACQDYNFGNLTDWFGAFRGGFYGFKARVYGVETHNELVHSWIPKPRTTEETEYHVTSILFNMDSAIECFTFMLNALGYAASAPGKFRDVTAANTLRRIAPKDVLDKLMKGYTELFPNLQSHWILSRDLISTIMEQHDASKHRQTIYTGGKLRQDPPTGFYECFNTEYDPAYKVLLKPHAEILLRFNPKEPRIGNNPARYEDRVKLEDVVSKFCTFINQSCVLARDDAKSTIKLKFDNFQQM